MNKINKFIGYLVERTGVEKGKIYALFFSTGVTALIFFDINYLHGWMSLVLAVLATIALMSLITLAILFTGVTVVKALFVVSTEISLLIFLAQAYCEVSPHALKADNSLKLLIIVGAIFIVYKFFDSLISDLKKRKEQLDNNPKKLTIKEKWVGGTFFFIFMVTFIWAIYQVVSPIISNLCVYSR